MDDTDQAPDRSAARPLRAAGSWLFAVLMLAANTSAVCGQGLPGSSGIPSASSLPPAAEIGNLQPTAQIREINQALARRGTVAFRDTPLNEVLYTLSEQWHINIVAGADITGVASGLFRDATLHEILDAILTVNGYGYRQNGGSLVVLKLEEIGPGNPNFRAETLMLPESIDAQETAEIAGVLAMLSSPRIGKLQSVPSARQIIVYDTPEQIAQMRGMLAKLIGAPPELPGDPRPGMLPGPPLLAPGDLLPAFEIAKIRPQYVSVTEVAQAVALAVGGEASFTALEQEQVILVTGSPEAVRRAHYVASQVDVPRTQVRITAYIYDISLGELERLGVDWSSQMMSQGVDANGIPRNNVRLDGGLLGRNPSPLPVTPLSTTGAAASAAGGAATSAAAAAPTGGQWFFRTLSSNWELSSVIQALDQTKGARLLADPHVTVVDRETASIDIITKIPVQQLTQTQQGGAIGTTAFEEAGIKLNVTPRIAGDGTVEMIVEPEFSTLTGFQNGNPIIDARRARTTVRVADQHTLVIGGLRQKTAVETVRGIPGLMNVKFIGRLFRTHNTEMLESELICFIQPEIIDFTSGALPREEIAVQHEKHELSQIPLACPGPHVPDCRDPHCPYHHPRPRPNPGLPDTGLVQPFPQPAAYIEPVEVWQGPISDGARELGAGELSMPGGSLPPSGIPMSAPSPPPDHAAMIPPTAGNPAVYATVSYPTPAAGPPMQPADNPQPPFAATPRSLPATAGPAPAADVWLGSPQ